MATADSLDDELEAQAEDTVVEKVQYLIDIYISNFVTIACKETIL